MNKFKVIWTNQARAALKSIYKYYKNKSLQGARNVRSDILQSTKLVYFSKQYQVDDINPKYRRIVVRSYKILYTEKKGVIQIMDIVSSQQSPDILKDK